MNNSPRDLAKSTRQKFLASLCEYRLRDLIETLRKLAGQETLGRKCPPRCVSRLMSPHNPITIPKCSYNVYPAEIRIDGSHENRRRSRS
ncbi:hypothetical protein PUN28_000063 [Cardiocondyla obscurior]|uniref:Uncharacterized protein n=1 Tax=Cardiocondyla obscurior TaxID=286306 RepID=A0AAW2GXJ2_9HYME